MTLYLKYRPKDLDELDLEDVRNKLKKIVSSGKIPHAFIFSGPKGTGKTSAARILAKIVNCEKRKEGEVTPCGECSSCLSISKGENLAVIEIDAASHRGIDDIRTLREGVKLASASKKKIYIIDEAHMLTLEASNALLKTLEEPPEHVIFILATTNIEKLIETIRSRATVIDFRKASTGEIIRCLKRVVRGEGWDVPEDVLEVVASYSDGSFRDAVKNLEEIFLEGISFKKNLIEEFFLGRKILKPEDFLKDLKEKKTQKIIKNIEDAIQNGVSVKNLTTGLLLRLKSAFLAKLGLEGEDLDFLQEREIVKLIELFSEAEVKSREYFLEQLPLEIAVVNWCEAGKDESTQSGDKKKSDTIKYISNKSTSSQKDLKEFGKNLWDNLLSLVKSKNISTEALLRAAKPLNFKNGTLTLGVYYNFHKERLETPPHRQILEEAIKKAVGTSVKVNLVLMEPPKVEVEEKDVVLTEREDEDIIEMVKEIFGD